MAAAGQWTPSQALGRRYPIGCVALEITQRCNLDCTLCYLSENAEAVKDTPDSVAARIEAGAGTALSFDAIQAGHRACNRYAIAAVVNGRACDILDDKVLAADFLSRSAGLQFDRRNLLRALTGIAVWALRNPALLRRGAPWLARKAWTMRRDLAASRGRAQKISFFVHNFMDAHDLDQERLDACAFMVATAGGPVPMCQHNAERDQYILKPFAASEGYGFWNPVTGRIDVAPAELARIHIGPKSLKGRDRAVCHPEAVSRTIQLRENGKRAETMEAAE